MKSLRLFLRILVTVIALASALASAQASAASVTINGSGSTIVINKLGGFDDDPVYGAQREAVIVAAAQVWADILVSTVAIEIDAQFTPLSCNASAATLGSAGPQKSLYYASGAETYGMANNTWYPIALFNAKTQTDNAVAEADITAQFNSQIDGNDSCMSGTDWYYGLDHNPPNNDIDFFEVVLHEIAHGLGVISMVDASGNKPSGLDDTFSNFLKDQSTGKLWSAMTTNERLTSMLDTGDLVWSGAQVNALVNALSQGVKSGEVRMYAPNPYENGSSVSHFDTALTPDELMEPQYAGDASYDHTIALLKDIGWTVVTPNNVPVISAQSALSTAEDTALTLALSDFTVTDSDNSYPADFTLTVMTGNDYSVSDQTLTPAADFVGNLTVPVLVNDGQDDSAVFQATVSVTAVNDAPEVQAQTTLSLAEDASLMLSVSDFTIVDPDDSNFTLIVNSSANYSVSAQTITPSAHFFGQLTVPIQVNDGDSDSSVFNALVSVTSVNDVPVIQAQQTLGVTEGNSLTLSTSLFTINDPDDSSFTLSVTAGANYQVNGLQVTPDANFIGDLTVPVTVNDGEATSAVFQTTIQVVAENEPPVVSVAPDYVIDEDTSLNVQLSDFTIIDSDSQTFELTLLPGDSYTVLNQQVIPEPDFNGQLNIGYRVSDGIDSTAQLNLAVTVQPVNDAPVLSGLPDAQVDVLALYSVAFSATDIDSPSLTYELDTAHAWLSITANGVLTGTPQLTDVGSLPVVVRVSDGDATDDIQFDLTVLSSDNVDLAIELSSEKGLINVSESSMLTLTLTQQGNATEVDATVTLQVTGFAQLATQQTECDIKTSQLVECTFSSLAATQQLTLQLASASESAVVVRSSVETSFTDVNDSNDQTQVTVIVDAEALPDFNLEAFSAPSNDAKLVDFNGQASVVFANSSAGGATVYALQEGPNLQLMETLPITSDANAVAVADLNQDGRDDLVFANNSGNDVFLGAASGLELSESLGQTSSHDVLLADINQDGYDDLIFANNGANTLYVNDQQAGFVLSESFGNADSRAVAVIDFNQDGRLDLVFANQDQADRVYLRNSGNQVGQLFNVNAELLPGGELASIDVLVADLNADGLDNEIAFARESEDNHGSVIVYHIQNSIASVRQQITAGNILSMASADQEGDGDEDILLLNEQGIVQWLTYQNQQFERTQSFATDHVRSVAANDINNDGLADWMIVRSESGDSSLLISQASGSEPETEPETEPAEPTEPQVGNEPDSNTDTGTVVRSGHISVLLLLFTLLLCIFPRKIASQSQ